MTETGRECGTSASSAPSRTAIWMPSASARSTTMRENVRHRIAGSGPESSTRSRGARGIRTAWISNSGQSIARVIAVDQPHHRARGLEVDEVLGVDRGELVRAQAARDEGQRGRRRLAGVVPALEGADERWGPKTIRTTLPAQRLHGIHGTASARCPSIGGMTTVAELRAGDAVDAVFACSRKDRLMARSGVPYLALELRDRSGAIAGRAFRDADVLAGRFERGDLVRVAGRVERFRDELQIEVQAIARAEGADPASFLPVAYRDVEELDGFLEHLAREVHDAGVPGPARPAAGR